MDKAGMQIPQMARDSLEDQLHSAILAGDIPGVSNILKQGANVNFVCLSGKTLLGIAAEMGNATIVEILLNSRDATTVTPTCQYQRRRNNQECCTSNFEQECESEKSPNGHKQNLGYFVVVHNDRDLLCDENWNSSGGTFTCCALNDAKTPEGMDKLEWDEEVRDEDKNDGNEDDIFSSQYRWYADILDRTSSLLLPAQESDLNHQDLYGRSAVHYAAEKGFLDVIHLLIDSGCLVDIGDTDNLTPLHLASVRDHPAVAKTLLEAGAKVNAKTSDKTCALHYAASRGFVQMVNVLIEAGAKVDTLDASDRTPLMVAVSRGHEHVVDILIRHGAKVNTEEIHGYTPLCEAVWQKAVSIVEMLLQAGAKITQSHHLLHYAVLHHHYDMAQLLIKAGSIVNLRDENGNSPLIIAAWAGECNITKLLLANGANPNYPNSITGSTPLHEAVEHIRHCEYPKFERMFHILRSYGASLNLHACTSGDSPLYRAILLEKYDAAMLLIKHGTDVAAHREISFYNMDIMFIVQKRNHFALTRMLVYAGYDIHHNSTPIFSTGQDSSEWLKFMTRNPLRLSDICRIVIRRQLGEQIYDRIKASNLPHLLNKFVCLEQID